MRAFPAGSPAHRAAAPVPGSANFDMAEGAAAAFGKGTGTFAGIEAGPSPSSGPGPGLGSGPCAGVGAGAAETPHTPDGLRRHRLAWLHPAAWDRLIGALRSPGDVPATSVPAGPCAGDGAPPDPCAVSVAWPEADGEGGAAAVRECLAAWAARGWPLVATRQDAAAPAGRIALGLPAPVRWGRRRIALLAAADGIVRWGDFGGPESVAALLPAAARPDWERLGAELRALGVDAGVYGSHGWQALTGEDYLHPGSDLDLLLPVPDADRADRVAALLDAAPQGGALPRLDGELALPGGAAVAWREWRRWRAGGMAGAVLVKRLRGAALARGGGWLAAGGAA